MKKVNVVDYEAIICIILLALFIGGLVVFPFLYSIYTYICNK